MGAHNTGPRGETAVPTERAAHRPDHHNLDSISLLCAECEGYWPCRYASESRVGNSRVDNDANPPGSSKTAPPEPPRFWEHWPRPWEGERGHEAKPPARFVPGHTAEGSRTGPPHAAEGSPNHVPWFARLLHRIFGRSKSAEFGSTPGAGVER